jgi:hypothetical protein
VAWPWGLFAIGVQLYSHGTGNWYRTAMISSSFMFAGLRMGLGALLMVPKKKSDFPRYDVGSLGGVAPVNVWPECLRMYNCETSKGGG